MSTTAGLTAGLLLSPNRSNHTKASLQQVAAAIGFAGLVERAACAGRTIGSHRGEGRYVTASNDRASQTHGDCDLRAGYYFGQAGAS